MEGDIVGRAIDGWLFRRGDIVVGLVWFPFRLRWLLLLLFPLFVRGAALLQEGDSFQQGRLVTCLGQPKILAETFISAPVVIVCQERLAIDVAFLEGLG